MSVLKEEHRILVGSEVSAETVDRLISYYQHNGYELVTDNSDDAERHALRRGERGAGWYSSEMTELFTELEAAIESDVIVLRYCVDVKGQRLTQEDRAFWGKEAASARAVIQDGADAVDLRPAEKKRVSGELKRFYINGVIFTVVFVLFVLLLILLGIL